MKRETLSWLVKLSFVIAQCLHFVTSNSTLVQSKNETNLAGSESASNNKYKLPSWFDYELYKRFYGKQYSTDERENEARKRIYLRTALKVFEQRALYRAGRSSSLSSINELSDLTSEELRAFKGHKWRLSKARKDLALAEANKFGCCSYDQVYKRIIRLLNKTMDDAHDQQDLTFSRAYIRELEQRPLVEFAPDSPEVGVASPNEHENADLKEEPKSSGSSAEPSKTGQLEELGSSVYDSVRKQIEQQLGAKSEFGRRIEKELSEFFGEPVKVRATIDSPTAKSNSTKLQTSKSASKQINGSNRERDSDWRADKQN